MIHNESRLSLLTTTQGMIMDEHTALSQLEGLAYQLGIQIRYEKIGEEDVKSSGGLCLVKGTHVVIVNSKATTKDKIQTLVKALRNFDLSDVYIRPALRDLLEKL
jgi:N-dimethylarginine dimethylaminohydrolase